MGAVIIVTLVFFACLACMALCGAAYRNGFDLGKHQATRHMENQAFIRGYGEYYLDFEGERQFRWVCKTIVEEREG